MSAPSGRLAGIGMALLAALMFSVNGVLSKQAIAAGVSVGQFTALRNAGTMILLGVFLLAFRPRTLRLQVRELPFLAAYGVIAFAIVQFLYFVTISNLNVGIGTLLIFLAPTFTALYLRIFTKAAIGRRLLASLALTIIGLALVSQAWTGVQLNAIGVIAGIACAIALVSYWVLGETGQRSRDPLSLSFYGFVFATAFWTVVVPWWTQPWGLLGEPSAPFAGGWTLPIWSIVLWTVVLGTLIPFLLILGALRRLGAQRTGLTSTTEPVLASICAFLLLGETISWIQGVGGLIVLGGIVLAETSRRSTVGSATLEH